MGESMLDARCLMRLPNVEPTNWYRKLKLMARKLLVGWFMECLVCKATFIWTTPENWTVGEKGKIFRKDTGQQASGHDTGDVRRDLTGSHKAGAACKGKVVGTVRCPDCLSENVRLAEIGDGK
jgi:hypothetical protein